MVGEKARLRFCKTGALRFISHHDLMRCVERILRRAEIPFKSTAGFHPFPRVVFALSLPLGVLGLDEVVEIELMQPISPDDLLARLNFQAPFGLSFHSATIVDMKANAMPRRAVYRIPIPAGGVAELTERIADILAEPKVWLDKLHPRPRRVNVRPYIRRLQVTDESLSLDVWVTGQGTVRAEDLLRLLGLGYLLDLGTTLERTTLEIHDEVPTGVKDGPPAGMPETAQLEHALAAAGTDDHHASEPGNWGQSPQGPVVE